MPSRISVDLLSMSRARKCRGRFIQMRGGFGRGIGLNFIARYLRFWNSGIICRIAFVLGIVKWNWHGYILGSKSTEIGAVSRGRRIIKVVRARLPDFARESSAGRNLRLRGIRTMDMVADDVVNGDFRNTNVGWRADICS